MASVHVIRLRRPWHCEPLERSVRFRRAFNRPTGLAPRQAVWLVLERISAQGHASLNGRSLGTIPPGGQAVRFDVAALLAERNELVVEVVALDGNSDDEARHRTNRSGIPGDVRLEIEEA